MFQALLAHLDPLLQRQPPQLLQLHLDFPVLGIIQLMSCCRK
jgi:hypothetical protein